MITHLLLLVLFWNVVDCNELEDCSTIGCVHAAAQLIRRINNNVDPCDDFYDFACGTFVKNAVTPDEKITINTETVLVDELDGNLFRILKKPSVKTEKRPYEMAKSLYRTCMDTDQLKKVALKEVLKLLDHLGGWPVLKKEWNEKEFSLEKMLNKLHEFVGHDDGENIFHLKVQKQKSKVRKAEEKKEKTGKEDESALIKNYAELMFEMAVLFGAEKSIETKKEMFDALELGIALNQLLNGRKFKPNSTLTYIDDLQNELDMIKWLELFDRFKLEKAESEILNRNVHVYDNLKMLKETFTPRDFANYFLWRVVDFASLFLHEEALAKVFAVNQKIYGLLDKEQRWKFCTQMANKYAELAVGKLYINEHFPKESRQAALDLTEELRHEFINAITKADWMNDDDQQEAIKQLKTLDVYMGYDERLLDDNNVIEYYGESKIDFSKSFFLLSLQLNVQKTDKKFLHKFKGQKDWTEYAKPTSSKASYNSRDHTIYFAAAFLQPPNFDNNRPTSMNYGAIGSIIAHELTHCLDRFLETVSDHSKEAYRKKVDCIVNQYSNFFDEELNTTLKGDVTKTEDTADNGGVSLAFHAYENWLQKNKDKQKPLISIEYTSEQLFWISYAQFHCSVQRKQLRQSLFDDNEVHSFERYRVHGPIINSRRFAHDFQCKDLDKMSTDKERCLIW